MDKVIKSLDIPVIKVPFEILQCLDTELSVLLQQNGKLHVELQKKLASDKSIPFFLNERYYCKLQGVEQYQCLLSVWIKLLQVHCTPVVLQLICDGFIYGLLKREAGVVDFAFKTAYEQEFLKLDIAGLKSTMLGKVQLYLDTLDDQTADSFKVDLLTRRTRWLVGRLFTVHPAPPASDELVRLLLDAALLASHPLVQGASSFWLELLGNCFQWTKVSVDNFVESNFESLCSIVFGQSGISNPSSRIRCQAAINLAQQVYLVATNDKRQTLVTKAVEHVPLQELSLLKEEDFTIWSGNDGELCFDPLLKDIEQGRRNGKKSKAELEDAAYLAKNRKLTPKEQAARDNALKEEAECRRRVQNLLAKAQVGMQLLIGLASSTQSLHFTLYDVLDVAIDLCVIVRPWELRFDQLKLSGYCFSSLHNLLARLQQDELAQLSGAILSACFRLSGAVHVPENWLQEELTVQVQRIILTLFELCIAADFSLKRSLPSDVFPLVFPLFRMILEPKRVQIKGAEARSLLSLTDECVYLVASHCEVSVASYRLFSAYFSLVKGLITGNPQHSSRLVKAFVARAQTVDVRQFLSKQCQLFVDGLLSADVNVRYACLQCVDFGTFLSVLDALKYKIWILRSDNDDKVRLLAQKLWMESGFQMDAEYLSHLMPFISSEAAVDSLDVAQCVAKSIASAVLSFPQTFEQSVKAVCDLYVDLSKPIKPEFDRFGLVIPESLDKKDPWQSRLCCAQVLLESDLQFQKQHLPQLLEFMIDKPGALGDVQQQVRETMLKVGENVITNLAQDATDAALDVLCRHVESETGGSSSDTDRDDRIRQAVIILLGTAAEFLDAQSERVDYVLKQLFKALSIPSESIQIAVAECLPPLIRMKRKDSTRYIKDLFQDATENTSFATRRGSAFGLAGVVSGVGLKAFTDFDLIKKITECSNDKKSVEKKQGAMFIIEALAMIIKRLFEPYLMDVLPCLLTCFGDSSSDVRLAAIDAAKVVMSNLSSHSVKVVLPSVLAGLDEIKWRSKAASCEMLGSMAFLAPRQLALSLPLIIPKLTRALSDSHANVQKSAKAALEKYVSIIINPEIKKMANQLLNALADPAKHSAHALVQLNNVKFAHYVDAPSLALTMPVILRGLKERTGDAKISAGQSVVTISSLVDKKDLTIYITQLLPLLREVLCDPVPEVRSVMARALGQLMSKLGEEELPLLISDLFVVLKSGANAVDRQGAAQGLAEIALALGVVKLNSIFPEVLSGASASDPNVKEAHISLLMFLAALFNDKFIPYIAATVPMVLNGLADENDMVRESAMKAGKVLVEKFSKTAIEILLPELEGSLFSGNYRIRLSSVQLLGDLLFTIGNINRSQLEQADEDTTSFETGRKAIIAALGLERYQEVLASVYIMRSDVNNAVRHVSINIWKALVSNTTKTLKEIIGSMMKVIVDNLSSPDDDKRQTAAGSLGELVVKLGDQVLVNSLPIITSYAQQPDAVLRKGGSVGLAEVLKCASKVSVEHYMSQILPCIKYGLLDEDAEIRAVAAVGFDRLHGHVGNKVIELIVPKLMEDMQVDAFITDNRPLDAIKNILVVKPAVLPLIAPSLVHQPLTRFKLKALTALLEVAHPVAVSKCFMSLMQPVMEALEEDDGSAIMDLLKSLINKIDDESTINMLLVKLAENVQPQKDLDTRRAACIVLKNMVELTKVTDLSTVFSDWIEHLITMQCSSLVEGDEDVVEVAWATMNSLVSLAQKDDVSLFIQPLYEAIKTVKDKLVGESCSEFQGVVVDGFCLPKGIQQVVALCMQCLQFGDAAVKEQGATALDLVLSLTNENAIKPFVVQICGPIIRMMSDKQQWKVKCLLLAILDKLMLKVPQSMRPFMPQLQRTFIKSLCDKDARIRGQARTCMSLFIQHVPNLDSVAKELEKGVKDEDLEVREGVLMALWLCLDPKVTRGRTLSTGILQSLYNQLSSPDQWHQSGEGFRRALCLCSCAYALDDQCPSENRTFLLKKVLQISVDSSNDLILGSLTGLQFIVLRRVELLQQLGLEQSVLSILTSIVQAMRAAVSEKALVCITCYVVATGNLQHVEQIIAMMQSEFGDFKIAALTCVRYISIENRKLLTKLSSSEIESLVKLMIKCCGDRSVAVKSHAKGALLNMLNNADGTFDLGSFKNLDETLKSEVENVFQKMDLASFVTDETDLKEFKL
ncbi:hypothetical protein MP228_009099 [Amoeboaphelidium protococcarum]|nr:hypothetical protein MP228_009099 [Amoeboaphelidium protococcarum]